MVVWGRRSRPPLPHLGSITSVFFLTVFVGRRAVDLSPQKLVVVHFLPHSTCTRCRSHDSSASNLCPECVDWSPEQWKNFDKKRRYRRKSVLPSWDGFSSHFPSHFCSYFLKSSHSASSNHKVFTPSHSDWFGCPCSCSHVRDQDHTLVHAAVSNLNITGDLRGLVIHHNVRHFILIFVLIPKGVTETKTKFHLFLEILQAPKRVLGLERA